MCMSEEPSGFLDVKSILYIKTYRFIKCSKELDVRLKTLRGLLKSFEIWKGQKEKKERERAREVLVVNWGEHDREQSLKS